MKLSKILCANLIFASAVNISFAQSVALKKVTVIGEKLERSLQNTNTSIQVFNELSFLNDSKLNDVYEKHQM